MSSPAEGDCPLTKERLPREGPWHGLVRQAVVSCQGREGQMDIERISVEDAHRKVQANEALLVCAYDDDAKCRALGLDGSISLTDLQAKTASLPKSQEIIFFCA